MAFSLTWTAYTVIFEYSGLMSSRDIIESNEQVYGDSRFDHLRWQLIFADRVETVGFIEQDVKKIAFMDRAAARANTKIKVAFAGSSELIKNLFESYSKWTDDGTWDVYYFESREAALRHIEDKLTSSMT